MKNRTHVLKLVELLQKFRFIKIIRNLETVEIEMLFCITQIINDYNIFFSSVIHPAYAYFWFRRKAGGGGLDKGAAATPIEELS